MTWLGLGPCPLQPFEWVARPLTDGPAGLRLLSASSFAFPLPLPPLRPRWLQSGAWLCQGAVPDWDSWLGKLALKAVTEDPPTGERPTGQVLTALYNRVPFAPSRVQQNAAGANRDYLPAPLGKRVSAFGEIYIYTYKSKWYTYVYKYIQNGT